MIPRQEGADHGEVRVMLLPTQGRDLLVPASAVAEIVSADAVQPLPDTPEWLLGELQWRGRRVPAVAFAPPPEGQGRGRAHARVVVCFMPAGNPALPFVALYSRGMPRLERAAPDNLITEQDPHPFALSALALGERHAWLPDFAALERALLAAQASD
ncbi:chemotaxis protein CheW [Marichromatium sp. AB32]|uniref:chemotaxis protein CheW n=1 Tax=Marichromatium sp. AB32 TaxID=2483363 RepID=UPI000F41BE90|nr:chemotaxis protein CheW [Marichromatium sp. AB32]RNE90007.1 chemotaxis protein CheW [Marichromatium sp. AB32]